MVKSDNKKGFIDNNDKPFFIEDDETYLLCSLELSFSIVSFETVSF